MRLCGVNHLQRCWSIRGWQPTLDCWDWDVDPLLKTASYYHASQTKGYLLLSWERDTLLEQRVLRWESIEYLWATVEKQERASERVSSHTKSLAARPIERRVATIDQWTRPQQQFRKLLVARTSKHTYTSIAIEREESWCPEARHTSGSSLIIGASKFLNL